VEQTRKPAWTCPACGFEAKDDQEKDRHMKEMASDPKHKGKEQAARPS
jgi:hypothetical protein